MHRNMIGEVTNRKTALAAVSPKSDQMFGSGCDNGSVLPLPAPSEHTHHNEATSEQRESGRQWRGVDVCLNEIKFIISLDQLTSGRKMLVIGPEARLL